MFQPKEEYVDMSIEYYMKWMPMFLHAWNRNQLQGMKLSGHGGHQQKPAWQIVVVKNPLKTKILVPSKKKHRQVSRFPQKNPWNVRVRASCWLDFDIRIFWIHERLEDVDKNTVLSSIWVRRLGTSSAGPVAKIWANQARKHTQCFYRLKRC